MSLTTALIFNGACKSAPVFTKHFWLWFSCLSPFFWFIREKKYELKGFFLWANMNIIYLWREGKCVLPQHIFFGKKSDMRDMYFVACFWQHTNHMSLHFMTECCTRKTKFWRQFNLEKKTQHSTTGLWAWKSTFRFFLQGCLKKNVSQKKKWPFVQNKWFFFTRG